MRSNADIVNARMMAGAHEAQFPVTPLQRAALFGMRCALGMYKRRMPTSQQDWFQYLRECCRKYSPTAYTDTYLGANRVWPAVKTPQDWLVMRAMALNAMLHLEVGEQGKNVLLGIRIACAWVLEMADGGRGLEQLMRGLPTEAGVSRTLTAGDTAES